MIDKQKLYSLLGRYIGIRETSLNGMYPDPDRDFWIPMTEELSKNIDETIAFLEELDTDEFLHTLEILDDLIETTQSLELLEAVRKIGKEKGIDDRHLAMQIQIASSLLDDRS